MQNVLGSYFCNEFKNFQFFYDDTIGECFPFLYKGCGGNGNNYKTISDCSKCKEQLEMEKNPECERGNYLLTMSTSEGFRPVLGRRCEHNFCPLGFDCVQGRYLAHCCGQLYDME
ncbi:Kunitz/Bovine pancreatic trypsin inhibitor domain protein [Oesophagostomum dentatum]|uniref:Kunitz/Bovine pancreatic trypsin inhibitor domain protein n=1 Tax=Oesophagostomum dentatum TaxID=61180 RepID=A0A0B1SXQ0_OESDE|nr:Kunitz/Bovine pancreatic trypsin inhibitor domain protein [Oesophagostomum dentatum]